LDEPPSYELSLSILSGISLMYGLSFVVIVIFLFTSALVSASEVAFFSLKADDLERCQESKNPKDQAIVAMLKKPRLLLATILIFNNLVNVGFITISTFLMWEITGTRNPEEVVVGVVTFAATFAITFFGEIIPKVYATKNNLMFARLMSSFWKTSIVICRPLSKALISFSRVVESRFEKKGYHATVEELNQALELATKGDDASDDEREILRGIVNFGTLTVRQVMKSRMDISAVDVEMNFHELMDYINKSGFSRMPAYRETIDRIEGVLYIKDLLPFIEQNETFIWQKLLRPGFFVPENKRIDSLLKDFQEKRVHMALVVDEYGGILGLITLEDIIEEIIGEINDEFDEESSDYQKIDEHTFLFEGKVSLHDFCKALDIEDNIFDEVKGESESLGGLILELTNDLPNVGKKITYEPFTFSIEAVDKRRIKRVRVHIHEGNVL
jgi:magnesium and cobalt exporter, CNNM family